MSARISGASERLHALGLLTIPAAQEADDMADSKITTWRDIPGCEGRYRVSDAGDVLNVLKGRLMGQWPHSGYMQVRLPSPIGTCRVHRLVALVFIPNPSDKPHINHIDCNPANNHVSNLEWCTPAENNAHSKALGRMPPYWIGRRAHNAKFTDETVASIRAAYASGVARKALAKKHGVCDSTIDKVIEGTRYAKPRSSDGV